MSSLNESDIRLLNEILARLRALEKYMPQLSVTNLANIPTSAIRNLSTTTLDNLTQITTRNHSDLQNKNSETDVQHLTAAQVAALHAQVTSLDWSAIVKTTSDIADITTKSHTSLSDKGTNTHSQIDTHITNEPAASIATHAANASAHHNKYTDAEAIAAVKNAVFISCNSCFYGDDVGSHTLSRGYWPFAKLVISGSNYFYVGYGAVIPDWVTSTTMYLDIIYSSDSAADASFSIITYLASIALSTSEVAGSWNVLSGSIDTGLSVSANVDSIKIYTKTITNAAIIANRFLGGLIRFGNSDMGTNLRFYGIRLRFS